MAKTQTTYTPKALAEELDVDPKQIRSYLRKEFARQAEAKNTSWTIDEDVAEAVRARFSGTDEDES